MRRDSSVREFSVPACRACGRKFFPPRVLCPACGGRSWEREPAGSGTVEEVTTIRHAVGVNGIPISLASVRLDAGPVVVARLEADAHPGDRVELVDADGAPVAPRREA